MRFSVRFFVETIQRRHGLNSICKKLTILLENLEKSFEIENPIVMDSPVSLEAPAPPTPEKPKSPKVSVKEITEPLPETLRRSPSRSLPRFASLRNTLRDSTRTLRLSLTSDTFTPPSSEYSFEELEDVVVVNQLCTFESEIFQKILVNLCTDAHL